MNKAICFLVLFFLTLPAVGWTTQADQFTAVVVSPLTPQTKAVLGTDGNYHIVYELELTNTRRPPATLLTIEVLDSSNPSRIIAAYQEGELLARLRTHDNQPPPNSEIEFNGTRLFLIHIPIESYEDIPRGLLHHVKFSVDTSDTDPTPIITSYTAAPFRISPRRVPVIGRPLAGKGWVAVNGCCGAERAHRNTGLPVNGRLYYAQRFAVDWIRLDDQGRFVHGDLTQVGNYTAYGADVLAIANGTVIETLDTLDDQVPGSLPDRSTITAQTLLGNHIILELHNGLFAFYAHLQKGPFGVRVQPGDHVRRGQVIGKLGNTGNTSAPHLHLHLMDGPSAIGSNGIPFVIRKFDFTGQIPDIFYDIEPIDDRSWSNSLIPTPLPRRGQFPLDLDIINFERNRRR